MKNKQIYTLALVLIVTALAVFIYKLAILKVPLQPDQQVDAWDIEVQITFQARREPAKVTMYLPQTEGRYEVLNEHFVSGDYGLAIHRFATNRKAVWSVREANGQQYLLYRATVRPLPRPRGLPGKEEPVVQPNDLSGARLAAANFLLESLRKRSADTETLVGLLITELAGNTADHNIAMLLERDTSIQRRIDVATQILSLGGIPARIAHGFELETLARRAVRVHWLEVHSNDRWTAHNAVDGGTDLPERYLPWWRNSKPMLLVDGGDSPTVRVSTTLNPRSALVQPGDPEQASRSVLLEYSLLGLPIETRAVYHVLLTVPLGVFLLVILRNIVGIKTFGTFMPVLIALAFRETQLAWGIGLFVLVVGLGLAIRFYFDRLKLLLVPRLASVLIIVILLMAVISVVSFKLGLPRGLSVALFPMVILTMTIERMSIVWEERGAQEALQQGIGSLLVAALAYLLMNIEWVGHFVFVFPESLLLLLALTIVLGRYSGYRLSELARFRVLAGKP